jgi:hypothetical protein
MKTAVSRSILAMSIVSMAWASTARAQWAVVDAPAIVQLIQEVQDLDQMISTARSQLDQAKQALQTMTGDRGMERLLSGQVRNYLPATWTQIASAAAGGGGILAADVRSNVAANAVLSPQRLATLSPSVGRDASVHLACSIGELERPIRLPANADQRDRIRR